MEIINYRARWAKYQGSSAWYRLKDQAMVRARNQCEGDIGNRQDRSVRCNCKTGLEMHHVNYPLSSGVDCLDNVRILCRECHQYETDIQNEDSGEAAYYRALEKDD